MSYNTKNYQENGDKLVIGGTLEIEKDLDDEQVKQLALDLENVKKFTDGLNIKKIIVVKNKIVNIVVA